MSKLNKINRFQKNENLKTVLPSSKWQGNPVDKNNRFINHEHPFIFPYVDLIKWKSKRNKWYEEKKRTDKNIPVIQDHVDFTKNTDDVIIWLGHATFFIRIDEITFIIDPVFESPSIMLKRETQLPFNPIKIPALDYILLSHDHRDHVDHKSLRFLAEHHPNAEILTGLQMDKLLTNMCPGLPIQCAGWYQQYEINTHQIDICFWPARHWGKRALFDTNKRLWGGFVIQSPNKTIYFTGDTGYGSHLKQVNEVFGKIDLVIMGIGAYKPEWFMYQNHISPTHALQAAQEMKAEVFIPMHYGTFDLSDEPVWEPLDRINQEYDPIKHSFKMCPLKIGEVFDWKLS